MKKLFMFGLCIFLLVSFSSAYSVEFFHSDHLGSPSVVSSGSGSVVWSADYDVFGETINEEGANKVNYNSKERDNTGLLYYGSRYYNPATGRFITVDSVKGDILDSQSQNRYVYVQNNPLKYADPTGNQKEDFTNEAVDFWVDKATHAESSFATGFYHTMGLFATLATPEARYDSADILFDTVSDAKAVVTGTNFAGEDVNIFLAVGGLALPGLSAGNAKKVFIYGGEMIIPKLRRLDNVADMKTSIKKINGIEFTEIAGVKIDNHALQRMDQRRMMPSAIKNAVDNGELHMLKNADNIGNPDAATKVYIMRDSATMMPSNLNKNLEGPDELKSILVLMNDDNIVKTTYVRSAKEVDAFIKRYVK